MASAMVCEAQGVWLDKWRYEDAEGQFFRGQCGGGAPVTNSNQGGGKVATGSTDNALASRLNSLELENKDMRKVTDDLQAVVKKLEQRITALECGSAPSANKTSAVAGKKEQEEEDDDDDDDIDLFGSDDEADAEAERIKEERIKAYAEKKSKKPVLIAKSNVILDVKPWDDETDMAEVEKLVRTIVMPGLLWGTGKLVPVGYGIKKLTISCVVEDEKVSIDDLEELITGFEDHVQSVDIAAFNKI